MFKAQPIHVTCQDFAQLQAIWSWLINGLRAYGQLVLQVKTMTMNMCKLYTAAKGTNMRIYCICDHDISIWIYLFFNVDSLGVYIYITYFHASLQFHLSKHCHLVNLVPDRTRPLSWIKWGKLPSNTISLQLQNPLNSGYVVVVVRDFPILNHQLYVCNLPAKKNGSQVSVRRYVSP